MPQRIRHGIALRAFVEKRHDGVGADPAVGEFIDEARAAFVLNPDAEHRCRALSKEEHNAHAFFGGRRLRRALNPVGLNHLAADAVRFAPGFGGCPRLAGRADLGRKPRTWTLESLTGRELCRMIAMGYEFNLQARLDKVREAVQSRAADGSRTKMEREEYRRLLTWLNDRSALGILEWFDCIETIKVDTPMAKKRWSTETTRRDQLFLELIYDHEL